MVIVIIGILAGLAMPSIKSLGHPNVMAAASRQLADDFALARQRAIAERANVFVVFFTKLSDYPADITGADYTGFFVTNRQANQLVGAQYATYALFTRRGVGDQPGQNRPRYLTEWRHLPEGVFIPASEFADTNIFSNAINFNQPSPQTFPFPTTNLTRNMRLELPWIGFDPQGSLIRANLRNGGLERRKTDLRLRLTQGSVIEVKNPDDTHPVRDIDMIETPPYNSNFVAQGVPDTATRIRLNWLTGRSRVEWTQIP